MFSVDGSGGRRDFPDAARLRRGEKAFAPAALQADLHASSSAAVAPPQGPPASETAKEVELKGSGSEPWAVS